MSLGQNLQFLRKRDNITQEQLAETLEVSRQSVSKWESDTSFPEMEKLIQIANLFHCTIDDLMQRDVSSQYVEDKNHYDKFKDQFSKRITFGVGLILTGLTIMTFLMAILPSDAGFDAEMLCTLIFFLFVVAAVAIFIVTGMQNDYFEKKNPYIENFYSEAEKEAFHKKSICLITSGVVLIIFGLIVMLGSEVVLSDTYLIHDTVSIEELMNSVFLLFVTVAVTLFVYAGTQESKYNIDHYNLIHDPNSQTYKNEKKIGVICGSLMMIATIIFLSCGLIWNLWSRVWIVYPVFGISCGIVSIIVNRNNTEEK